MLNNKTKTVTLLLQKSVHNDQNSNLPENDKQITIRIHISAYLQRKIGIN